MILKDIIGKIDLEHLIGSINVDITDVQFDSRKINKGALFIAIKGEFHDGHEYIDETINCGVRAVVVERLPEKINNNITYVLVKNSSKALAFIASNYYDNPSKEIKLIGVTGTNGKTTTVTLLHQLFKILRVKTGLISTIRNMIGDREIQSTHTTPDALQINFLLRKMIENDCKYCFMEVSSHAIVQLRILGLHFSGGVFTNISREHLDYHKTFSNYINVKKSFFDSLSKSSFAIVNKDDKNGMKMIESTQAKKITYSIKSLSDYRCKILENQFNGMLLSLNKIDLWVKLIGKFNAYNILSVYAISNQFFKNHQELLSALSMLDIVEGRFQRISANNITCIVDYAHTDDALKNVLETINDIKCKTQSLVTVIGCGGDRDKEKRPRIGSVAFSLSTQVIFTADNPRTEDVTMIIDDMLQNLSKAQQKEVLIVNNRIEAIKIACRLAKKNDIVLVAGKGHEKYQEINGKKIPFDDLIELKKSLNII